ncbi:MAG: hypothetical protein IT288_08025 [Bdellovibrionales bacterium]|nr:hypothetical protein [Bdellovibrionales bacterium]
MNVKSILPQLPILEGRVKAEDKRDLTLDESRDRDPNGRQERGGEQHPQRPMTEEELKKVLEIIKALPGISASSLRVKLTVQEGHSIVVVEGPQGEVVRRLAEADLWQILLHQEKKTGQILDKAM